MRNYNTVVLLTQYSLTRALTIYGRVWRQLKRMVLECTAQALPYGCIFCRIGTYKICIDEQLCALFYAVPVCSQIAIYTAEIHIY